MELDRSTRDSSRHDAGDELHWHSRNQSPFQGKYESAISGTGCAVAPEPYVSSKPFGWRFELPHELGRLEVPLASGTSSDARPARPEHRRLIHVVAQSHQCRRKSGGDHNPRCAVL